MNYKNKKFLLILVVFVAIFLILMVWRDLHLNLEEEVAQKSAPPELTVESISFERVISDKLWKVTSPQAYKQGDIISAKDLNAYVKGNGDQTNIKAKFASYHTTKQIFDFIEPELISKQKNDDYAISANKLSFDAQKKRWNLHGNVCADSKKISLKTHSATVLENKNTYEMPNGGKVIWREKR